MPLNPGDLLGPYEILARLGAGGMGEVYKARDTRLGRIVAVKIPHERFSERFKREARLIASLNHPNICTLFDVGPDYLVMEYIEAAPLQGPLPVERALVVALQIVAALEAAHAKGITHRDLKPANILVADHLPEQSAVKLLDFGLAKVEREATAFSGSTITQSPSGTVLGTAAYLSPEQASGEPADARSDIFSFGAVLYELLTGLRAFEGKTQVTTMAAVLRQEPPPFDAPPDLERIVRRCLRKSPAGRFQTVAELKVALEALDVATERPPSVAVLPFANMSGDKEQEYFSDGLAEEVINTLARTPGLKVIARTSAFAFKGQNADVRHIAQTLGVTNILEGSVRRAGGRIRVTAQLITATDGSHIWSDKYDREMADVFAVQDEIAKAIAVALQGNLAAKGGRPRPYTPKLPAYEAFLKALYHFAKFSMESIVRSKEYLEQAIALDAQFAPAHSALAECFIELAYYSAIPGLGAVASARAAAHQALSLDPSLPEAHAILGQLAALNDYDWSEAEREFRLAMARQPVPARVRWYYAHTFLLSIGRLREAMEEIQRALEDDPIFGLYRFSLALCLHAAGKLDEANTAFRQVLELDENFLPGLYWLTRNYTAQGMIAEALALAERAFSLTPWNTEAISGLAGLLMRTGARGRAEELLGKLGDGQAYGAPIGFANFYYLLGEPGHAAKWLEKAIAQRHFLVPLYIRSALARSLREGPYWPAMAKKMNLPEVCDRP